MLNCQKELFSLKPEVHYLNNAYRAPLLKSSEEAGIQSLINQRNPFQLKPDDFFDGVVEVRRSFAQLVNCQASEVAVVPSTSYGFTSVLNNIKAGNRKKAVVVKDEFPSGYFAMERWTRENQAELQTIDPDSQQKQKGESWNQRLIEAIDEKTAVVLISSIHWMSGVKFDLKAIGEKCHQVGAYFIVDGTQSVGALPMDVDKYRIDALVCAAYKWLLGPYSLALAYIGEKFANGIPLEESWMNRVNARDFGSLSDYSDQYEPGAGRFNVGETSNFIMMPMLKASLSQLLEWRPEQIQAYAKNLNQPLRDFILANGGMVEKDEFLAYHLICPVLPENVVLSSLKKSLDEHQIYLSARGENLRVSVNVFNTEKNIESLIEAIKKEIL
ncbi:aminotransferase class V-fold PLP-dependent enzyme [Algoriphagus machipongonensis]|uniref:Aminotransferase, class V n=1 Tax=Algoriphagus machipongonensis TaxID=388413 RepID=A3I0B1_9BACT|nr:aminotransferase class V-fold PLP-dependent enzyme [Algoriphagus machipongonensis]EAZ79907.1 aminotransferase, class V [Algoriphagus machipongonensis]